MLLREQLRSGQVVLQSSGTSMLPGIEPGTDLVLEKVLKSQLKVGDVLCLAAPGGRFMIHRLLGFRARDGYLFTRGDWRSRFDPPVSHEEVVGRVRQGLTSVSRPVFGWSNYLLLKLVGEGGAEQVARILLVVGRCLSWLRWRLSSHTLSFRVARADWESELVGGLCGIDPKLLEETLKRPREWLCYLAYSGAFPVGCALCLFSQGRWSLEAFGCLQDNLYGVVLQSLHFRCFGVRVGVFEALKNNCFPDGSLDPDRLLRLGFVFNGEVWSRRW